MGLDSLKSHRGSVNVIFADNGFMLELNGEDNNEKYVEVKIICPDLDDVNKQLTKIKELPVE